MKVKRSIKDAAKKGNKDVCRILAKEIVNSRKAVNKMYASKAQLSSVEMSMKNQLGINNCRLTLLDHYCRLATLSRGV